MDGTGHCCSLDISCAERKQQWRELRCALQRMSPCSRPEDRMRCDGAYCRWVVPTQRLWLSRAPGPARPVRADSLLRRAQASVASARRTDCTCTWTGLHRTAAKTVPCAACCPPHANHNTAQHVQLVATHCTLAVPHRTHEIAFTSTLRSEFSSESLGRGASSARPARADGTSRRARQIDAAAGVAASRTAEVDATPWCAAHSHLRMRVRAHRACALAGGSACLSGRRRRARV